MGYKVVNDFIEKEHNGILYQEGDTYPKDGFEADSKRVKHLQSDKNKYGISFLEKTTNNNKSTTHSKVTTSEQPTE